MEHSTECNDCDKTNFTTTVTKESDDKRVDVFPIIPDQLLSEMGSISDQTSIQEEEELEDKFAALSLTLTIDSTTIKDRCERHKIARDQTEKNLADEIRSLTERVNNLTTLCVNMETTELVATILAQINRVVKASVHAFSSAERYGSAQLEEKLSKDAQLIVKYVNSLKQKRNLSKEQCTKAHLLEESKEENSKREKQMIRQVRNSKQLSERRNSIATLKDNQKKPNEQFSRRTSECFLKTNGLPNITKQNRRSDLNGDLVKIKEGTVVETETQDDVQHSSTDADTSRSSDAIENLDTTENDDRRTMYGYLDNLQKKANLLSRRWSRQQTQQHIFYLCSLFCFCFAVLLMADILFEIELSKR
ncbi:hypothetical protein WA026_006200 [Henosepilachna vigintioctopunctata]|uniref:Uncharacterized protein n=1 Tax=Henosepilachna vigintioctopunctata TaxID=420089 RepID=A0AAW1TN60_9CUCU